MVQFFWGVMIGLVSALAAIAIFAPDAFALILLNHMPV